MLTTAACFGADLAVFMHVSMPFAIGGAFLAGGPACLQHGFDRGQVLAGPTAENPTGGLADVGAVKVSPDTLAQISNHVFGKAGIRASGTDLGAFKAGGDAFRKLLPVQTAGIIGMGFKH